MNDELKSILERVGNLYMRYGIKSVTMDDVARELGISKKTLYQYVSDKADLVEKFYNTEFAKIKELFCQIKKRNINAIEQLLEVYKLLMHMLKTYSHTTEYDLKKYYPELSSSIHGIKRDTMYKALFDNMIKGKKEGLFREDFDEEIIARIMVTRFECLPESTLFNITEFTSSHFISQLFIYHIHGIASEKGMEVFEKNKNQFDFITT